MFKLDILFIKLNFICIAYGSTYRCLVCIAQIFIVLLIRLCVLGRPTPELIRPILCRECKKPDLFTVSILKYWAQEYEDKLGELLYSHITRSNSTPNRKRPR